MPTGRRIQAIVLDERPDRNGLQPSWVGNGKSNINQSEMARFHECTP
jgi:hypothetical protein